MMAVKLKIGGRLAAGFAAIIVVMAGVVAFAVVQTGAARTKAELVRELRAPASQTSLALTEASTASANALRGFLITHDDALRGQWNAQWERIAKLSATMDTLAPRFTSDKNRETWTTLKAELAQLKSAQETVMNGADPADPAASAAALKAQVLPHFNAVRALLVGEDNAGGMAGSQAALLTTDLAEADAAIAGANTFLLIGAATMIVIAGLIGFFTARGITVPLGALNASLRQMAEGKFDIKIPGAARTDEIGDIAKAAAVFRENGLERERLEAAAAEFQKELDRKLKETEAAFEAAGRDQKRIVELMARRLSELAGGDLAVRLNDAVAPEYRALKDDFNAAVASLEDAIRTISASTTGIGASAEEIAQASDDLSRRTEQQAASLEETAAALDEITSTVHRTAKGATEASRVVITTREDAERSGEIVRETVAAMDAIHTSSNQISQIIGVIDEIAFQTNLLALNAGVEAARAGDAGRGFAVVAQEVRALAQRSADAAKEIKDLISDSGRRVDQGVALVGQAGEALGRIVGQVAAIDKLVHEITASAQEQSTGLGQVNAAVNQMDQVVQQNAAMVEQATAATHSLKGETGELAGLVRRFKISSGAQARAAA